MCPQSFEGPEKKFEIVVSQRCDSLRKMGDHRWSAVVEAARARVLSKRSTEFFDAYLLSESSLFVFDDHATMITCGGTRLVDAALAVLELVSVAEVELLIYERKNEHFPSQQETAFVDDARQLAAVIGGHALRFGDAHDHRIELFHSKRRYQPDESDTTLEVLMHGLPPERTSFFREGGRVQLGLDAILPGFDVDEHVFTPAGYSLNALKGETYYTVHVTPEEVGSYVSFETNHDFRSEPGDLIGRVVSAFSPESFDVLAFVPSAAPGAPLAFELPEYRLRKQVDHDLCGYKVQFRHCFRVPVQSCKAGSIEL